MSDRDIVEFLYNLPSAGSPEPAVPAEPTFGIPGVRQSTEPITPLDVTILRDPIGWTSWRLQVHRLGPYAPEYQGRPMVLRARTLSMGFGLLAFVAAMLLIVFVAPVL